MEEGLRFKTNGDLSFLPVTEKNVPEIIFKVYQETNGKKVFRNFPFPIYLVLVRLTMVN
jgi:hypothetical protein